MKEPSWRDLVISLRHGRCVLVLGPEVPARLASSTDSFSTSQDLSYAEALTRQFVSDLESVNHHVTGNTLAAVAQQYEDEERLRLGPGPMRALAAQFYSSVAYSPSDVHCLLASLPFRLILTTCHDNLLIRALQESGKNPLVWRYHFRGDKYDNPEFPPAETSDEPAVYHLFGAAQEPYSLVLSENDVLDFLINVVSGRPPLPDSLKTILQREDRSFLFVGFGIRQLHLRVLLKVLVRALKLQGSAFAAEPLRGLSEGDREQTILFYERGKRIEVEDAEIKSFLTELTRRLEDAGGVTLAPPVGPRPRVFISYAREDSALAHKVCHALRAANFEPWLDQESLAGGDLWNQRIKDELEASDYVLVLYTPALCKKTDSYVNKEIYLARERGRNVRSDFRFLIPLRIAELALEDRISELREYQKMDLRLAYFDEDMAEVFSTMRRDYQRRRQR